ncbi:MAG: UDP-N-acetylmuramate dehydrogenase [Pseudonocardiales bacterium]|nr:UDP-N-acetylmuramate dehydrogenase [Pseudonocardiales bacterium]
MVLPDLAVPLAPLTTLRLGGPARRLVEAPNADAVVTALREAEEPVLVVGGGSNLVIADDGWPGVVVRVGSRGRSVERRPDGSVLLTVEAGEDWDEVVAATVADGLGGLECLSGIPGRTGATPVQNVGAYGVEIADVLVDVDLYDRAHDVVRRVPARDLGLAYRTSTLKGRAEAVVLRVRFDLPGDGLSAPIRYAELARTLGVAPGERVPATAAREAVLALRRGKGMVLDPADHDTWSVGSFFTNPLLPEAPVDAPTWPAGPGLVKVSAAWLIERSGFRRGHEGPGGRVALSRRHVLALTHRGGGSTADLLALAAEVRDGVRARFGVSLTAEPVLVGCTF